MSIRFYLSTTDCTTVNGNAPFEIHASCLHLFYETSAKKKKKKKKN